MANKHIDEATGTQTVGHEWDGIEELDTPMPRWWLWTFYASIVFAVIVIEESELPHEHLIVLAIYLTVGLSVLAHGLSAAPLAARYARWYEATRDR